MKINSEKSMEMIISFTQDVNFRNSVPNIVIEGKPVKQVGHAKLLGVTLSILAFFFFLHIYTR